MTGKSDQPLGNLTKQDRIILAALSGCATGRAYAVAQAANIHTMSRGETAARHLIKLTRMGYAEKRGTRMFPAWVITDAGRAALNQGGDAA